MTISLETWLLSLLAVAALAAALGNRWASRQRTNPPDTAAVAPVSITAAPEPTLKPAIETVGNTVDSPPVTTPAVSANTQTPASLPPRLEWSMPLDTDSEAAPQRLVWTPELVSRFWNGFAHTRLVELSFSRQAGRSLVLAIEHLLTPQSTVLDYGAGDGYLVRLLCERGYRAAAYEPSEDRSENLRRLMADCPGFDGVESVDCARTFDVVIMAEVIEHILDEEFDAALRRLANLVTPGGVLVITTPNNEDLELNQALCPVTNQLFHRWQHVRSFTPESLSTLLARYGFAEIVSHQMDFSQSLFLPYDSRWGDWPGKGELPAYLTSLRANMPTCFGNQTNLMYLGRRKE